MNVTASQTMKMILVDDEAHVLRALERELSLIKEEYNINVVTVESGAECLSVIEENPESIFLVITDLRMPGMSGSDLIIKINEDYPNINLVLLTAYKDAEEIRKIVGCQVQSLLFKPWNHHDLVDEVHNAQLDFLVRQNTQKADDQLIKNIESAGDFQRKLFISELEQSENIDLNYRYEPLPFYQCGGDFFDALQVDEDKYLLILGDVSGHGVKPAIITGMLKVLISSMDIQKMSDSLSTSAVLTYINKNINKSLEAFSDVLVTCNVVMVEPKKRRIQISNAGHLPVYVLRGNKCLTFKVQGMAMGFDSSIRYSHVTADIKQGDIIVMLTDGLTTCHTNQKQLGANDIVGLLENLSVSDLLVDEICNSFKAALETNAFTDDITVLTLSIL